MNLKIRIFGGETWYKKYVDNLKDKIFKICDL